VARQFSTGTKFGSEKGKVQKPARIPPQTPPAGGKKAEAGQFHSPRKIVCPAESKLVFRIFGKKSSNFVQYTPPVPRVGPLTAKPIIIGYVKFIKPDDKVKINKSN
jgi:hypothetical protein